jgi:ATP-binding cassette, subfamily B, bacterial
MNDTSVKKAPILFTIVACLKTACRLDAEAVLLTVLASIVVTAQPYVTIFLSAYVVDGLHAGIAAATLIRTALMGVGAIFVLKALEGWLNRRKDVHVEICVRRFNMEMSRKTLSMDYQQLDSPRTNEIRTRIHNDHNWGAGFYSVFWQLSWLLGSALNFATALVVLLPLVAGKSFFADWTTPVFLALLIAMTLSAALFNSQYVHKKTFALMDEMNQKNIAGYLVFGGVDYKAGKDIRVFGASPLIQDKLNGTVRWAVRWVRRFSTVEGLGGLAGGLAAGILQGGAYLFVVLRALAGALTVGSVLKYAGAIHNLAQGMSSLMNASTQFAATARRQQSTLEYLNVPDAMVKGTLPVEKRTDHEYEIEFRNVSFHYPGSEAYALKNVSLKLRIGERLAVVGMNGSGKTTFIKLLCRLYDPTEGEILLNGIDIRKYDYGEYLSLFSVVFQDFRLFSFPLGQNVAAGTAVDKDRALSCLDQAGLGGRLAALPGGLETPLYRDLEEDGVEISGGEAQKIALARALYKDAPVIVLDEPTAALDPIAEYEIYSKFDTIVGDKTAIYISHRLSSCRFCDDIAVFHEGAIIQRGGHDQLLREEGGKYQELWRAQAQYYEKDAQGKQESLC